MNVWRAITQACVPILLRARCGTVATLVLSPLILAACDQASSARSDAALPAVVIEKIHFAPSNKLLNFAASIHSRIETDQAFRVGGKVTVRLVEIGQRVNAGDILGKLDDHDLKLQKQQADAEFDASSTALKKALAEQARADRLITNGWTTQAAHDQALAGTSEARGRNQRAAQAVSLAANALNYATLRAQVDGVVTATFIEPGQVVMAGQSAVRLARLSEKEAWVALPESYIDRAVAVGAHLTLWAAPERKYHAVLREVAPAADPATRTFLARYSLPDADDQVALGMSGTLTISAQHLHERVAHVPLSALFDQGNGSALWLLNPSNRLELKLVAVASYDDREAQVLSGVDEGDQVVVLGAQKLSPWEKVRPIDRVAF